MRPDNMTGTSLDQLCFNGTVWMNHDGWLNTKKIKEKEGENKSNAGNEENAERGQQ